MRPVSIEKTTLDSVCYSCEQKHKNLFFVLYFDRAFFYVCENCLDEGE